ncbi:MAG: AEC family transporter [Xenococcus sp. (in: cyanobacteria)]
MFSGDLTRQLLELYERLLPPILLGIVLGFYLPPKWIGKIGEFLFYIGIPITIASFLRKAYLSESVWIASLVAIIAVILGCFISFVWLKKNRKYVKKASSSRNKIKAVQGSFLIASMSGNTRYFGFPIVLVLMGRNNFGWAIFYDLMSSMIGAYGLGIIIASYCGKQIIDNYWSLLITFIKNPALWGICCGLLLRHITLDKTIETGLSNFGWMTITLSMVLIGMRLTKFNLSWRHLKLASISLTIKMLVVPLLIGIGLSLLNIDHSVRLMIVLLSAMPPAISTLIIAENYNLEKQLTVMTIVLGSIILPFTLLFWIAIFTV